MQTKTLLENLQLTNLHILQEQLFINITRNICFKQIKMKKKKSENNGMLKFQTNSAKKPCLKSEQM